MHELIQKFIENVQQTSWMEYVAVISGIASVWFSRKENILVYPVGLINTIFYVYISIEGSLFGEASVNFYYTVMSIYGWILWAKKDQQHHIVLHITNSSGKQWTQQLLFFAFFYVVIFAALHWAKAAFYANTIPAMDAFASATAFTGMWLMAKKKVESWYWWIATNIASIPLYFIKGYVLTSGYYLILLILAFFGLVEWQRRARAIGQSSKFDFENK
ncbi:MAG: nicotinamide mononucleotide transporter [Flavisolibacter sp.]|nr:nicotinamide mononucleotide transporter [Flavisolibacter sp.]